MSLPTQRWGEPHPARCRGLCARFRCVPPFRRVAAPDMRIVGPGSVGEGIRLMPGPLVKTEDLLKAYPRPAFDIFSYHSYAAASKRCTALGQGVVGTTAAAALSDDWLARPDQINTFYEGLRDRFQPNRLVWITRRLTPPVGAILGQRPFSIASGISINLVALHSGASKSYFIILLRRVTMASSIRIRGRRVRITGSSAMASADGRSRAGSGRLSARSASLCTMFEQPPRRGDASSDQSQPNRCKNDQSVDFGGALHSNGGET